MDNRLESATAGDLRAAYAVNSKAAVETRVDRTNPSQLAPMPDALRIPVGTNLADVERWMIYVTLRKCGGNKTRAAALLGVSLKTLYNRLNAYRAQGVALDEGLSPERAFAPGASKEEIREDIAVRSLEGTDLRDAMIEVPQRC